MARTSTNGAAEEANLAALSEQMGTLREDLAELANTVRGIGKAKSAEFSARARNSGAETAEYMAAQAKVAQDRANDFVVTRPGAARGIAAGAGFLIGYLTSRR